MFPNINFNITNLNCFCNVPQQKQIDTLLETLEGIISKNNNKTKNEILELLLFEIFHVVKSESLQLFNDKNEIIFDINNQKDKIKTLISFPIKKGIDIKGFLILENEKNFKENINLLKSVVHLIEDFI